MLRDVVLLPPHVSACSTVVVNCTACTDAGISTGD